MAWTDDFVNSLSSKYGAPAESPRVDGLNEYERSVTRYKEMQGSGNLDLCNEGVSSPDQLEQFKKYLEAQYARRGGSNDGGGGGDDDDTRETGGPQYATPTQ